MVLQHLNRCFNTTISKCHKINGENFSLTLPVVINTYQRVTNEKSVSWPNDRKRIYSGA